MTLTTIDVTGLPPDRPAPGDWVEILGPNQDANALGARARPQSEPPADRLRRQPAPALPLRSRPAAMTITLANHMDELPRLIDAVAAFVAEQGIRENDGFELALVLEEIFSNIVSYAFDEPGRHTIEVALERRDGVVHVHVADAGRPFDPRDVPPPDLTTMSSSVRGARSSRRARGPSCSLAHRNLAYERRAGINHLSFQNALDNPTGTEDGDRRAYRSRPSGDRLGGRLDSNTSPDLDKLLCPRIEWRRR